MDESRYYCFHNTHVLVGSKVIGISGAMLCTFYFLYSLMCLNLEGAIVCAIFAIVYSMLVVAQRRNNAKFYLPYLIVNGAGLVVNFVYIIFLGAMFIMMPSYWQEELDIQMTRSTDFLQSSFEEVFNEKIEEKQYDVARTSTGIVFLMMIAVEALTFWFQTIVYYSYRYMTEERTSVVNPDIFIK